MYIGKIISIFIFMLLTSGCDFNLEKVSNLRADNKKLEENNELLREELRKKENTIKNYESNESRRVIEINKIKSASAEKQRDEFLVFLKILALIVAAIFSFLGIRIIFDFYLTRSKMPKQEEIEAYNQKMKNSSLLLEKARDEQSFVEELIQQSQGRKERLESEIEQLEEKKRKAYFDKYVGDLSKQREEIEDKMIQLRNEVRQLEKYRDQAFHEKNEAELLKQNASEELNSLLAQISAAEKRQVMLASFTKK